MIVGLALTGVKLAESAADPNVLPDALVEPIAGELVRSPWLIVRAPHVIVRLAWDEEGAAP